jgi:hypothetical protein
VEGGSVKTVLNTQLKQMQKTPIEIKVKIETLMPQAMLIVKLRKDRMDIIENDEQVIE